MGGILDAFYAWLVEASEKDARAGADTAPADVQQYFHGISRARYVIRRVFRIVDDLAKSSGLDPLEHQALIQVFGASEPLRVNDLAERLDIPPALASRLVKSMFEKDLVSRASSELDRRTTLVSATAEGQRVLVDIDSRLQARIGVLQGDLTDLDRAAALGIFAFYLGVAPSREHFARLADVFGV